MKKLKLYSIEESSLIRKFTVLFMVMSLLPFLILAYLFTQYIGKDKILMDQDTLLLLLFLTGFGTLAGFWGMRRSIIKIQEITKRTQKTLSKPIPALSKIDTKESEVIQLAKAFNEITKNLEENIKRLEASKRTIQYILSKVAFGMSSFEKIDTFLELIIEIVTNALEAKRGILLLKDEENEELYVKVASGLEDEFRNIRIKLGEGGPGWVAQNKKPLLIPKLQLETEGKDPFMPPLLCVPLIYQNRVIGVLAISGRLDESNFREDELSIASNLASQIAVAVENERLHLDAEETYFETVSALAMAVEARDPYSRGHSDRVSDYAVKVAQRLGLDEKMIKDIKDAAELHDVGKIGIGDDILKKGDLLSEEEKKIMHKHPIIGEGIIKPIHRLSGLCDLLRHHHEWLDGTGYPDGLKGDEICLGARILSVVDSFDAMTTDRPYRKALSIDKAKEELKKYSGIRYDPKVIEAFLSIV